MASSKDRPSPAPRVVVPHGSVSKQMHKDCPVGFDFATRQCCVRKDLPSLEMADWNADSLYAHISLILQKMMFFLKSLAKHFCAVGY